MEQTEPVLSVRGIGKAFNGNRVLADVSFDLRPGEILGLVGENGAGKSTLMKILFGMPVIAETGGYEGSIRFDGKEVRFRSSFEALDAGIGMVHQEFSLIPGFTTMENILLNRESMHPSLLRDLFGERISPLDRVAMEGRARKAIDRLGVRLEPGTLVREMPVGHKQFTEIARELDRESVKLIVLDEPTAVLTESEAEVLLASLRTLASQGIAIIFISHRLREVVELCHRVVVLRDGHLVRELEAAGTSTREIASLMVGRAIEGQTAPGEARQGGTGAVTAGAAEEAILSLEGLWVDMPGERVAKVDLAVRKGEILGIGGLAGQGKLGIPNGIMGLHPAGGRVRFKGEDLPLESPLAVLRRGLAFVSEDRRGVGLLLDEGIDWNIAFTAMQVKDNYLKPLLGGLLKWRSDAAMEELAREYIKALEIKCTGPRQRAGTLSGGNQQKVCLAKAFALEPELLFVSEPTRGIDIGAKRLVLDSLVRRNRESGTTIVMVSSELEELRSICDRVAIVYEGRIEGILPGRAAIEDFGVLMAGADRDGAARSAAGGEA